MNWYEISSAPIVSDLGWTLVHSIWQFGAAAAVLTVASRVLASRSADLRCAVSVAVLLAAAAAPIVTFASIYGTASRETARRMRTAEQPAEEHVAGQSVPAAASPSRGSWNVFARPDNGVDGAPSGWVESSSRLVTGAFPILVGLWMLGVAFLSLRLGGGLWHLHRFGRGTAVPVDEVWNGKFNEIAGRLGIRRKVELVVSTWAETPIAVGLFRPLVIVPASAFLHVSPEQLETVIAHELVHLRRYDPIVNAVQNLIETIFFYHPAIWWMSAEVRREREFATDAAVVASYADARTDYASALAKLEEIRSADQAMTRLAAASNGGNLMKRIELILNKKTEVSRASSAWTACMALMLTSAVLLSVFSISPGTNVNAESKGSGRKLAIGFVSIPPLDRSGDPPKDSDATARLLIEKLKRYNVPATGFLMGGMVSDGERLLPVRANIARLWRDAGFEVGLGGFKHIKLYNTPVDEYIANIEKNERVFKQLLGDKSPAPRYFSYPFLNAGKTSADREKVERFLASRGMTPVKYTIDNNEWMYSWAYDMARMDNDVNTMAEIRVQYLTYIAKIFDHFEAYSQNMFGRDIPQTMVLTPSRLVTDTADEFFAMTAKRGYSHITVDEAQADTAYKTHENYEGEAGITWFERWAMAKGQKLPDEPRIDALVWNKWQSREKK